MYFYFTKYSKLAKILAPYHFRQIKTKCARHLKIADISSESEMTCIQIFVTVSGKIGLMCTLICFKKYKLKMFNTICDQAGENRPCGHI